MKNINYNAIVIGFGKGGKTLAGKLAAEGKSVALIEKDKNMYGGTCINVGCIPSKSLIHSAAAADPQADSRTKSLTYKAAVEEKRRLTAMLRQKNYHKLADLKQVTVYDGTARFTGPLQVEVASESDTLLLTADQVFINTGSTSFLPPIEGLKETKGVYTSTGLMDLDSFPERLVIIGGGYIGLEFASMYSGFGSKVSVIQDGGTFLPKEDEDVAAQIKAILEARGVEFYLGASIKKIEDGPAVSFSWKNEEHRLEADAVLVATGRIPNTKDLNCETAGIELTPRGAVKVDELLRTTAPNVWAMGDVAGGLQHTYVSLDDSRIVWSQLSGGNSYTTSDRRNVPYSVFLATPYSRVGMNEREASAAGYKVKIAKMPAAAIPKAQVLNAADGLLKAVIDSETGKILGAMLLCEESYEMINLIKLAMDLGADYTVLRDRIYTHPTMTEAFNDLFAV
ncbi:FAD-dependent oxidoreductase [Clostridium sp. AM58-1XD]|uniref:FAD-dependent oxidoreductase n=1 Tax=Clostridium sp. AM58-1XD TaxID=2292307 RepID=UPI000E507799|nr:FAD-dependent oxidoreductase [Clostridium sp. AM58-1XD]RGZ01295.1 pyridine nucleotide-disulfide oxidoreductase [Clostridium sp. AM58-1XD]